MLRTAGLVTGLFTVAFFGTLVLSAPEVGFAASTSRIITTGANSRPVVQPMVEYARADGTPLGPKAPGGMYCFVPIDADGEPDFDRVRAYGSVTRAVQLKTATLKTSAAARKPGLIQTAKSSRGVRSYTSHSDTNALFFEKPVTADEFCQLAKTKFEASLLAWNLF